MKKHTAGAFSGNVKSTQSRMSREKRMRKHMEEYAERKAKEQVKPRVMRKSDRPDQQENVA